MYNLYIFFIIIYIFYRRPRVFFFENALFKKDNFFNKCAALRIKYKLQDKTLTENTSVIKYHKNYMFLIQVIQVRLIHLRVNH